MWLTRWNTRIASGLITSSDEREAYHKAHGGLGMDLDVIADDYLHWPLERVAVLFRVACLVTPLAALVAYLYGRRRR